MLCIYSLISSYIESTRIFLEQKDEKAVLKNRIDGDKLCKNTLFHQSLFARITILLFYWHESIHYNISPSSLVTRVSLYSFTVCEVRGARISVCVQYTVNIDNKSDKTYNTTKP